MIKKDKTIYIVAGPNGSGKTTFAKELIKELRLPFLNADAIAFELSPRDLAKLRVQAGKIFLEQLDELLSFVNPKDATKLNTSFS